MASSAWHMQRLREQNSTRDGPGLGKLRPGAKWRPADAIAAWPQVGWWSEGAYEIPRIAPSSLSSRATVCPQGSVRAAWSRW
jgi:hypothetical protein